MGFEALRPLEEGLAKTVESFRQQPTGLVA